MSNIVTLEQLEWQVSQLPPHEQLKLVILIGERLSAMMLPETDEERQRREYVERVEAFLNMCDEMAAETVTEVNSAEDIRQIREERILQL